MAKGYTSHTLVAAQIGRTLTEPQQEYFTENVLPAVEEWIDSESGRAYGEGVVTSEQLVFGGLAYTYLSKTPVTTLTRLRGWYWGQDSGAVADIPTTYYSLINPETGELWLPSWRNYETVLADYTPDATIPAKVKLAATILGGFFMRTVVHPQSEWLTEYRSAQDISLKFREIKIPETVYDLIGSSGGSIVVA